MALYGGLAENTRRNERQERGTVTFSTSSVTITVAPPMRQITVIASAELVATTATTANNIITCSAPLAAPNTNQFQLFQWLPTGHQTPGAAAAITVGASPFTYTNNDGVAEVITITGGTVSAVTLTRGGTTTASLAAASPFDIVLSPGDAVNVTYSATPTMTKFPFGGSALAASTNTVTVYWEVWGNLSAGQGF